MRAQRRVGAAVAAVSGAGLVGSLFLPWYFSSIVCIRGPCPSGSFGTGWSELDRYAVTLAAAGAIGVLLPFALLVPGALRTAIATPALLGGLAAAGLTIALGVLGPPSEGLGGLGGSPFIGVLISAQAGLGLALGGWLVVRADGLLGPRSKRAADVGRAIAVLGALGVPIALALPWFEVREPLIAEEVGYSRLTGWEAYLVGDVFLAATAAVAAAFFVRATLRDRKSLDRAGCFAAGLCVASTIVVVAAGPSTNLLSYTDTNVLAGPRLAAAATGVALLGGTWATLRRRPG